MEKSPKSSEVGAFGNVWPGERLAGWLTGGLAGHNESVPWALAAGTTTFVPGFRWCLPNNQGLMWTNLVRFKGRDALWAFYISHKLPVSLIDLSWGIRFRFCIFRFKLRSSLLR